MAKQLSNKLRKEVEKKANYMCELCGRSGNHQVHHIFSGKGRKDKTERIECLAYLCINCHRKLHDTGANNRYLKLKAQSELSSKGYNEDEIRKIVGGKLEI